MGSPPRSPQKKTHRIIGSLITYFYHSYWEGFRIPIKKTYIKIYVYTLYIIYVYIYYILYTYWEVSHLPTSLVIVT